jgi:hypothetical protein
MSTKYFAVGDTMDITPVHIPAGEVGEAKVVIDAPSQLERLRGQLHGQPLTRESYTRLFIKDELVMTDADFEIDTNEEFVYQARGRVLVAGLGIGLVLGPLIKKKSVESVLVIEKSEDVIKLVGGQYKSSKVEIWQGDILSTRIVKFIDSYVEDHGKFHTIYFDIWPNICTTYGDEIRSLKLSFRKYLVKGGWMHAWCEKEMMRWGG